MIQPALLAVSVFALYFWLWRFWCPGAIGVWPTRQAAALAQALATGQLALGCGFCERLRVAAFKDVQRALAFERTEASAFLSVVFGYLAWGFCLGRREKPK